MMYPLLLQRAGQYKLLTAEQEKQLAGDIQQLLQLKRLSEEMAAEAGELPSALEVAEKAGISPSEYQVRMWPFGTVHALARLQPLRIELQPVMHIAVKQHEVQIVSQMSTSQADSCAVHRRRASRLASAASST